MNIKSGQETNKSLPPIVYMTHGGPTQILETESTRFIESKKFAEKYKGKFKAIICISAHYFDSKISILSSDNPGTYHDHGFDEMFEFTWKVNGSSTIANEIYDYLKSKGLNAALERKRGLDHGCWTALYPFGLDQEDNKIPVIQVALPEDEDLKTIISIGEALKYFREKEYMIFASGSITHNLRQIFRNLQGYSADKKVVDYINKFKDWFHDICISYSGKERLEKMLQFKKHEHYKLAHPSNDHFLPIIAALTTAGDLKGNILWEDEMYGFKFSSYYFE